MARHFVYSTLTNDVKFNFYKPKPDPKHPINEIGHSVIITGGANRATKKLITPAGVMTEVSDKDLELLMKDQHFLRYKERGFITVRDSKVDPEVAAASDMELRDNSAPKTPESPEFRDAGVKVSEKTDKSFEEKVLSRIGV